MIGFDFVVPDQTYYSGFTSEESDFYDPQVRNWIQSTAMDVAAAHAVHVAFDAVIFDDGRLLGDDAGGLASHVDALVQARQNAYRSLLEGLDAGERGKDVMERLWPDEPDIPVETSTEWLVANEARNTVTDLLHHDGESALPGVLRRARLPRAFVIRRRPSS